jgi:predicted component of type VI protein secretion system
VGLLFERLAGEPAGSDPVAAVQAQLERALQVSPGTRVDAAVDLLDHGLPPLETVTSPRELARYAERMRVVTTRWEPRVCDVEVEVERGLRPGTAPRLRLSARIAERAPAERTLHYAVGAR